MDLCPYHLLSLRSLSNSAARPAYNGLRPADLAPRRVWNSVALHQVRKACHSPASHRGDELTSVVSPVLYKEDNSMVEECNGSPLSLMGDVYVYMIP
jgi:hypothetical protein